MQQTAELIGEKVHGDKHALGVKKVAGGGVSCGGKWAIFFSFGGTVQFPGIIGFHNNGYSLGLGFTVSLGCRSGILYPDFLFDFAGGKKIFGLKLPTVSKFGVAGTLGFNIASPSNDIVQASGAVDIAGSLIVGTPPSSFKIKVGIGFKILPLPDIPMGFAVQLAFAFGQTPAPRTGSVKGPNGAVLKSNQAHLKFPATPPALEQESEEQEEAEETSLEDSIYSTVGRSVKALLEHDFEDMFESGRFMAAMEIGASAMGNVKGNTANTAFPIAPEELAVSAGLKMKFCITCLPGIRAVNDGTVMKNPYEEPYAGHHFDTRRRRTAAWMNLAGKSTSQVSTGWSGPSSKAIDGNTANNYPSGSCTHTHKHQGAWWKVNLGGNHAVQKVKVTNRGDCCGSRLNGFDVKVGSTVCASNVQISQGQTKEVPCSGTGSSVTVQLRRNDYLTLCEVGVFAG